MFDKTNSPTNSGNSGLRIRVIFALVGLIILMLTGWVGFVQHKVITHGESLAGLRSNADEWNTVRGDVKQMIQTIHEVSQRQNETNTRFIMHLEICQQWQQRHDRLHDKGTGS